MVNGWLKQKIKQWLFSDGAKPTGHSVVISATGTAMGGQKVSGLGAPTVQDDGLRKGRAEITDSEVAAANKDGVAATASMRTLGTGAQQAAAGNHTHTVGSVEVIAPVSISGFAIVDWTTFGTGEVPDTANRVIGWASSWRGAGGIHQVRVLYNSVQQCINTGNDPYSCHCHVAGIGSAADLEVQYKGGAGMNSEAEGGGIYITLS